MVQAMRVLAKKMAKRGARPYVFIGWAMTGLGPSKAEAERRIDGDGADPEQGGERREAIQDAALCSAILGSIFSRRWARPSGCAARDIAMGEPVGLSSGPRSAKRPLGLCP